MGLFSGPRRRAVAEPVAERSIAVDPALLTMVRDYSQSDASIGQAVQSIAVYSTVDLICSLASELPVQTYTGDGRKISTPGNVLDPGGDGMGLEDWVYRLLSSWLLAGNAFGIESSWDSRTGRATAVELVHPDDVTCTIVGGSPVWRIRGEVAPPYFVHRRVNPSPGRVLGLSRIEAHAAMIGVSLSATRFGRQWFAEGAHPSSLLTNTENLTQEQAQAAKSRFMAVQQGSREPLVLGKGWDHKQIQISPEESQFLQTSGLSEAQCARIFGPGFAEALGYETGGSMTYANVVDRRQDLLVFSLNRWLRRVERVLSDLTPRPQYVRLNRDALLEATTLQRYQAHKIALDSRWRTVNEVREIEDLPPVAWGDEPNGASAPEPAVAPSDHPEEMMQ